MKSTATIPARAAPISKIAAITFFTLGVLPSSVGAFYVPGITAIDYEEGAKIAVKVNSLTSVHTQLPIDYYRLAFCRPTEVHRVRENLGELLGGDRIENSPYIVEMKKKTSCKILCATEQLTRSQVAKFSKVIKAGYHHNFILDNLPSASLLTSSESTKIASHYAGGFPIGYAAEDGQYLYNHLKFVIDYHQKDPAVEKFRVVKFSVEPFSVHHRIGRGKFGNGLTILDLKETVKKSFDEGKKGTATFSDGVTELLEKSGLNGCSADGTFIGGPPLSLSEGHAIFYTYEVIWNESDVRWATRWDVYLTESNRVPGKVHWYAIINSFMVVVILSLALASILVRNLRRDIEGYNAVLTDEEKMDEIEESGWKLVHGDVFRPPQFCMMLSCFAGSGVQLLIAVFSSICLSAVGFLNPARRGSLLTGLLIIYTLAGSPAGYVSARLYKSFNGRNWQKCTLVTATLLPGVMFLFFIFLNTILVFYHTTASVPFLDIFILAFMWCCVSTPLVFVGAFFGYKRESIEYPTVSSKHARVIPEKDWYMNNKLCILFCGLLPFGAIYVELFFILSSIWMDQFYYVFGFTLLVLLITIISISEMCVLLQYYQLCAEDYDWWWRSFTSGGSIAFYIFLYIYSWYPHLHAQKFSVTTFIYFGYMALMSFGTFVLMGSVGFFACFWFTHKIFSSVKVD